MSTFPDLRSFKDEREPVLYLARRGARQLLLADQSPTSMRSNCRALTSAASATAPSVRRSVPISSRDRGIYRPGDEIRAGAIIKTQDWRRLPEGLPLRMRDHRSARARGQARPDAPRRRRLRGDPLPDARDCRGGTYTINLYRPRRRAARPDRHDQRESAGVPARPAAA